MPYHPMMIQPMKDEVTRLGMKELNTVAEVDALLGDHHGTTLLFVNSMCGCAAGMARPGIRQALQNGKRPDRVATVFAGQDLEATARARAHMAEIPPSSPSVAFFKDGELVYFLPRHRIEGRSAQNVAQDLVTVFEEHCETSAASESAAS